MGFVNGHTQGTATITAAGNSDVIAAPGAGYRLHILKVVISVYVQQDTGVLSIDDGTTAIWKVLAKDDNGVSWTLDFGDNGYTLGKNKALRVVVATANVSAIVTATARVTK
jgi:hypothetical protein